MPTQHVYGIDGAMVGGNAVSKDILISNQFHVGLSNILDSLF